jgi:hypothetical protein
MRIVGYFIDEYAVAYQEENNIIYSTGFGFVDAKQVEQILKERNLQLYSCCSPYDFDRAGDHFSVVTGGGIVNNVLFLGGGPALDRSIRVPDLNYYIAESPLFVYEQIKHEDLSGINTIISWYPPDIIEFYPKNLKYWSHLDKTIEIDLQRFRAELSMFAFDTKLNITNWYYKHAGTTGRYHKTPKITFNGL